MSDRTGVLILRAWLEEGSSEPLRVQIRSTTDVSAGEERSVTLSRRDSIRTAVEDWLDEFVAEADRSD